MLRPLGFICYSIDDIYVAFEILYIDLPGSLILVLIRVVYVGVTVVALVIHEV